MSPDVEIKKNICGETSVRVKGYEPQSGVDTYYAYAGDPLYEKLDNIANNYQRGSACDTTIVEVLLDEDGTCVNAFREDVKVVPTAQTIDTGGYNIPFTIYYNGNRKSGTWDNETKTFT